MGRQRYGYRKRREDADERGLIEACFVLSKRYPLFGFILFFILAFIAAGISASKPRFLYGTSSFVAFILVLLGGAFLVAGVVGFVAQNAWYIRSAFRSRYHGGWGDRPRARAQVAAPPGKRYWGYGPGAVAAPPIRDPQAGQLLSKGEEAFWHPLQIVVNGRYQIQCKVNLADVVGRQHTEALGYHVDFLLCPLHSTRPLLVIELDDRSHWFARNRQRDRFKDQVLARAGIPIYRQRCQQTYDPIVIAKNIERLIARG